MLPWGLRLSLAQVGRPRVSSEGVQQAVARRGGGRRAESPARCARGAACASRQEAQSRLASPPSGTNATCPVCLDRVAAPTAAAHFERLVSFWFRGVWCVGRRHHRRESARVRSVGGGFIAQARNFVMLWLRCSPPPVPLGSVANSLSDHSAPCHRVTVAQRPLRCIRRIQKALQQSCPLARDPVLPQGCVFLRVPLRAASLLQRALARRRLNTAASKQVPR